VSEKASLGGGEQSIRIDGRVISETSLLAAALKKYDSLSVLALPLRPTSGACPGDIRAFWAAKPIFRAECHREREKARLAGGEGGIRSIECRALKRLAWPCSGAGNKALIGIPVSARSDRPVQRANSDGGCSTAE
jgi:hypothetical protein